MEKSTDATNYSAVKNPSGYIPLGAEDEFKASAKEMRLDVGSTTSTVTYYYKLRMWVSKDYEVTNESRFFTIRINAYGSDSAVIVEKPEPMSPEDFVNKKANNPGITDYTDGAPTQPYVFEHPVTEQTPALTDYRYIGNNPANYVEFNDELWRIIGIFDVDDGTGNYKKRMKLVRNTGIGNSSWDSAKLNNWSTSSLMTLLNSGEYYNRTGDYSTIGLNDISKSMISNAKWYLGSIYLRYSQFYGVGSEIYSYERGIEKYSDNPISWIGKIGLIYSSDYAYTYSNGVDDSCYQNIGSCRGGVNYYNVSWFYDTNYNNNDTTVTSGYPEYANNNNALSSISIIITSNGNIRDYGTDFV